VSEWLKVFAQMGGDTEAQVTSLIQQRISDFTMDMFRTGLEELTNRVDYLKPLEAAFWAANPGISAQYPPPK
jgi:hypothetical protein